MRVVRDFQLCLLLGFLLLNMALAQFDAPEPTYVDVRHYAVTAEIDLDRNYIDGQVAVDLTVLQETRAISFSFNRQMSLLEVTDERGERYSIRADDYSRSRVRIESDEPLRDGQQKTLTFRFEGILEREQYAFLDVPSTQKALIERDGAVLLSEGNWFPSHRLAVDGATTELRLTVPLGFTVVAPGQLESIETQGITEVFTWKSDQPVNQISAIVSRYYRESFDEGPVPLTFYINEDFDQDLTPYSELISELVGFYANQFGSNPLSGGLTLAQAGNQELSSTGAPGLILLEEAILDAYTIPVFELAYRIAQQWWGYSVRMKSPRDAWLKEGFSTYSALLFLQSRDQKEFETELAKQAIEALKYQDTAPVISGLDLEAGTAKYRSIVGSKGAWILYMLGQLIGEENLNQLVVDFYGQQDGLETSIPDFVRFVHSRVEDDYSWFFVQWIESVGVPEFRLDYTVYKLKEGGFKIRGQVRQNLELFKSPMELLIETKGQPEDKNLMVNGKTTTFTFDVETMPLRINLDPKGKILMDSDRMRLAVSIALGDEFKARGEYVSSMSEYEKAIEQNARSSLAHFRLGEVFFEQHSYSNAANSMRDCLNGDLKPEWVETWAHIYLGKVYDILGQRQRAKAEYRKAINSKIDYNGAQEEAQRYYDEPYTKPSNVLG